jgi:TonB-dependent heme/hemoglobin receptor
MFGSANRRRATRSATSRAALSILCCLFLCHTAAPVRAQDAPELEVMGTVQVTATRTAVSVFDVPAAVTVVGPEEIERESPRVVPDLLRGSAGVYVQETTPGQAIPIVRGLKGSEVLYLVDGMRLSNAIFRNSPNQYMALLDPLNVDSIEVVRGPSSALYGGDAMGGVVQVLTPTPLLEGEAWQTKAVLDNSYASAENAFHTHMALSAGREDAGILASFGYQDYDDRVAGGGEDQAHSGFEAWAGNTKLLYRPSSEHELLFDVQFLQQPETPRHDELVAGFGQDQPSSEVFFFEPNERLFFHGRYRLTQSTPLFDALELHAAHQRITDDRRARDFGDVVEVRERNASHLTGLTAQASLAQGGRAQLVYGLEFYHDRVTSSRTDRDIGTGAESAGTSRFPDDSNMDSVAIYGNENVVFGERFEVVLGGRYSLYQIELAPADRGVGAELSPDDLTGNIGVSYALTDTLKAVSNFGRGFRPPNIFDLGTLGQRPGNRYNIANPDLKPETVLTWDFGFKMQSARWYAEAIGYVSDYRDKITTVLTGEVTADGRDIVQNQNVNELRLYGAELDARYYHSDRLELYGALNYTIGDETFEDGSVVPADRIPPLNGRVGAHYALSQSVWIEGYTRFAARQDRLSDRDRDDPRIDPNGTPGWVTLNLRAGWQPGDRWSLQFGLENLLDENYREHGSGIDAPGISANVGLRATF